LEKKHLRMIVLQDAEMICKHLCLLQTLIGNKIAIQVKFERFMRERGEDCGNKFSKLASAARTQAS
jgi:hypothetical protein